MTKFNEDSRVKIPAILHLCRLGYEYLSLKDAVWNPDTNIFTEIFKEAIGRINPDLDKEQVDRLLVDTSLLLDNEVLDGLAPIYNIWGIYGSFPSKKS